MEEPREMKAKKNLKEYFFREGRRGAVYLAIAWIMKISFVSLSAHALLKGDYLMALKSFLAFLALLIPPVLDIYYDIQVPAFLDLIITAALFLHQQGLFHDIYTKIPFYDSILHTFSSITLATLTIITLYIWERNSKNMCMSINLIAFFTVITTMALGVVWEIGEFTIDQLFGYNTQPGLVDTMHDLILDTLGAILVALLSLYSVKRGKLGKSLMDLDESVRRKMKSRGEVES